MPNEEGCLADNFDYNLYEKEAIVAARRSLMEKKLHMAPKLNSFIGGELVEYFEIDLFLANGKTVHVYERAMESRKEDLWR
jgi:hypothetical protein